MLGHGAYAAVLALGVACLLPETCRGTSPGTVAPPSLLQRKTLFSWPGGDGTQGGPPGLDEPLASDRPDFTEASSTVGRGLWQLESGYTFIEDRAGGRESRAHSFPEVLLRIGVFAEWIELRIGQNYAYQTSSAVDLRIVNSGATDLYLGTKLMLTPQDAWLPEMSLAPQMLVPTGSDDHSNGEVLPGVNWLYGWDIGDAFSTGGNTQLNRAIDDETEGPFLSISQSWVVGYSVTERLGSYAELFGLFGHDADTELPEGYFDGGFTYQVTYDVQLDVRAGAGLNGAADNLFVGAGFVLRAPWDCDLP